VEDDAATQAIAYIEEGARALGTVPTQQRLVAERFFDESGGMQLIIHAPFGARINRAFGMGLRKKFCRSFDFELQAAATDDAVLLSLGPQHSFPLAAIFEFLHEHAVDEALTQAALQSPMWETRWRWNATRSLAVLRQMGGRRTPPPILRMRAADLLAAVFPAQAGCQDNHGGEMVVLPDHPLVNETTRDCLEEAMDAAGLKAMLRRLHGGEISSICCETVGPSPFSHGILAANPYAFLDDAPLEERWARQVRTARPGELTLRGGDLKTLDAAAVAAVVAQVQVGVDPPRDADELHDLLCAPLLLAPVPEWPALFAALVERGRATSLWVDGQERWIAAESLMLVRALWPEARTEPALNCRRRCWRRWSRRRRRCGWCGRWCRGSGRRRRRRWRRRWGSRSGWWTAALAQLELAGIVLQGNFLDAQISSGASGGCLQRIHRLDAGAAARSISGR
jgi:ATP-dependent Lhr-like helicase